MELRTVLIALLALLCIYLAWLAVRWRRVQRQARSAARHDNKHDNIFRDVDRFGAIPVGGDHAAEAPTLLPEDDDSIVSLSSRPVPVPVPEPAVRAPRPSEPDASGFGFDALLEVRQMRHLIDDLQSQQGKLAKELARLREELSAVRAASRVAPAYAEAVSMVQRGLDAQAIAERCGISVAEAELVRALSEQRSPDDEPAMFNERDDGEDQQEDRKQGDHS
ncbi:MAG: hypothetical protein JWL63_992 [Rhodocyclales bacterium]|nr:hypothetical protein [Rhodocyclales bacterium]